MRRRNSPFYAAHFRNCTGTLSRIALAALSFTRHRWPRLSRLSMGQPAARSRISGDLFRAAAMAAARGTRNTAVTNFPLAAAVAALQAHVFVRLREAVERRSELAQPHRAHISLSNTAAADMAGLVCQSTATVVS